VVAALVLLETHALPEVISAADCVKQAEADLAAGRVSQASSQLRNFVNALPDGGQQSLIQKASRLAEQLHALDTADARTTFQLAELYFLERRFTESLQVLTKIGRQRADADYFNLAGMNYAAMGDLPVASRAVIKAIELAPDRPDLLVNLGGLYQRARNNQAALAVLKKAVAMPAAQPQAFFALALTYYNLGNYPSAVENCSRATERNPAFAMAFLLKGRAYGAMGKSNEAGKELGRALALNASCDACQFELALLARSDQESEHLLRATLAINTKHADAHFRLGKLLAKQGRVEEAKAELRRSIELGPDQDAAYYQLAILYKKAGESENAKRIFEALRQRKEQRRVQSEANLQPQTAPNRQSKD
jgi:tetratricopeptide (TPR) repeat protein